jgi:hypothetical protein
MPNKVFISYRREDSQYQAGRIYEAFVRALPPDTVFMDVDSMAPGDDFVEALEGWVQQCDVLLALIGPRWIDSIDPRTNLRRLDNPEDFVRIEIRGALERKIPIVPVLLDAAKMPTAAELPDDIKLLPRRNAGFVDFRTFDTDVQRLITRLKIGTKIELPVAPGPQAGGDGNQTSLAKSGSLFEWIKPEAVSNPWFWPVVAGLFALAVTIVFFAARMIERQQLDARDGRLLAAVSRASVAEDAVRISESARRDAESKLTAAQAAHEESRRAARKHARVKPPTRWQKPRRRGRRRKPRRLPRWRALPPRKPRRKRANERPTRLAPPPKQARAPRQPPGLRQKPHDRMRRRA